MNQGNHPGASIDGLGHMFWNHQGMTMVTYGDATVMGSDENTTLVALGRGDVTFIAGDGNNIAQTGVGNDLLVGGEGYNRFFSGAGDDVLIGGNGINNLNSGAGNDTIIFGQWDQVNGGQDADHFVFVEKPNTGGGTSGPNLWSEYAWMGDINFSQGDTLDMSTNPEFTRGNSVVQNNDLLVFTSHGLVDIMGVGEQVTLVGGIDAAIQMGMLQVAGGGGDKG